MKELASLKVASVITRNIPDIEAGGQAMPLQSLQRLVGSMYPERVAVAAEQGAVKLHEVYSGHVVGMVMGEQNIVEFAQV